MRELASTPDMRAGEYSIHQRITDAVTPKSGVYTNDTTYFGQYFMHPVNDRTFRTSYFWGIFLGRGGGNRNTGQMAACHLPGESP